MMHIAIADADKAILHFLEGYCLKTDDIDCIFTVDSLEKLLAIYGGNFRLDYLLLDVVVGQKSSIELIPKLKKIRPQTAIIMFSGQEDQDLIFQSLFSGASGYLTKSLKLSEIKHYLHLATNGGAAITPSVARCIIQYFNPETVVNQHAEVLELNSKDVKILKLLADGKSYEMIASYLNISINSVRYHIKRIYKHLEVNSKTEAIRKYHHTLFV